MPIGKNKLPLTEEQYFLLQVASDRDKAKHFFKYIAFQTTVMRWAWAMGGLASGMVIGLVIGDLLR